MTAHETEGVHEQALRGGEWVFCESAVKPEEDGNPSGNVEKPPGDNP